MDANHRKWRVAALLVLALLFGRAGWAQESDEHPDVVTPATDGSSSDVGTGDEPAVVEAVAVEPAAVEPAAVEPAELPETAPSQEPIEAVPVASEPVPADTSSEPAAETEATVAREETPTAATEPEAAPQVAAGPPPVLVPAVSALTIEPASFKGVQPGSSTTAQLAEAWGPPKEIRKVEGMRSQVYVIDSFPKVTVTIAEGIVTSIVINLDKAYESEELARQLTLDDISSVQVTDDRGQLLGEAFPERGVLFGYASGGRAAKVSQVVLEPIDSQPFLLRAETHLRTHYARCLADANAALAIDAKSAQAQGLRARVFRQAGDYEQAIRAADAAIALEPNEGEWKLLAARILIDSFDFQRAKQEIQSVLDNKPADGLAKARARCLLGDCLSQAPGRDDEAIKHHQAAIKLAEPFARSPRVAVRRAAKEVLLDAHLGVAADVGWGHWQQKPQAVTRWLERASAFAQDLIQREQYDPELLLHVDARALAALAGVADAPDPSRWVDDCTRRGRELIQSSADPARTSALEWKLGLALCDAADVEQARGQNDRALQLGRMAMKHLGHGESAGRQLASHDFLVGRLYYRLGAVHAVGKRDHKQAVEWYGRAVKLLETPVPPSHLADPGRQGETFVSIAVSYWELGSREESMRLTKQGVKYMEQAVEEGLLRKSALAVPYGNLSSMHQELGDKQLAREYSEMASKCETSKR